MGVPSFILRDSLEVDGDQGTGDHHTVHDIPHVSQVRSWMKKEAQVEHFAETLDGKDGRETIVEVLEHQISGVIFLDGIFSRQGSAT